MSRYPIPKGVTRIETRASNSRFIATLGPASTVEEARAFLRSIREEMPDATHHVHAMRVGYGASVTEGMSDDGEPAGTSGPPALAVLRGADLGDVILVITRYFGGTKLGTGGLVAAYGGAAKEAVAAAKTEPKIKRIGIQLAVPYALYERAKQAIETREGLIDDEVFSADVVIRARIPEESFDDLNEAIQGFSAGKARPQRTDEEE